MCDIGTKVEDLLKWVGDGGGGGRSVRDSKGSRSKED